ncbi:MAG: hypothetical protein J6X07_12295, partial [Prevotella sp.]|nr:hypothetical protein [Prevotella sp.]
MKTIKTFSARAAMMLLATLLLTLTAQTAQAAFTNTHETGDLTVTNTVNSALSTDAGVEFSFTVTLGDDTFNGTYGGMDFHDGVATFTLKGGETK